MGFAPAVSANRAATEERRLFLNMNNRFEYLVISRGQWDGHLSREEIQKAIDEFYAWKDRLVAEGKMRSGQRLATQGKVVSKSMITDGPFSETKEVIGGYWFIVAGSLEEAAAITAGNPCLACGLFYEVRPIDTEKASAFNVTNETPEDMRGGKSS
jgi:hypothetical protein